MFELSLSALSGWLAFAAPNLARGRFSYLKGLARQLASKPSRAILLAGILGFLASALWCLCFWPEPSVHDEFSYLLGADTFANGRLSNPTHTCWRSFDTFHVLQHPSYQSKYPPGQSLVLATGQVLFGNPVVGIWLSTGLSCAALCWMLMAWLPRSWAFVGSLIPLIRLGVYGGLADAWLVYWFRSYWSGNLAAAGGALVYGALPRLIRFQRVRDGLLLGAGLVILSVTRPYEGLIVSVPAALVLVGWMVRRTGPPLSVRISRVVLPIVSVLALGAFGLGTYHAAVTGHPLKMPYLAYESSAPGTNFVGHSRSEDFEFRFQAQQDAYERHTKRRHQMTSTWAGWLGYSAIKTRLVWEFFLGPVLTIPILFAPWTIRNRWTALAVFGCLLACSAFATVYGTWPHYLAPALGLLLVIVLQGLRYLSVMRFRGDPVGRAFVRFSLVICLATALLASMARLHRPLNPGELFGQERARILAELHSLGGHHLVLVRYSPDHVVHHEWVYNSSNIDQDKVVWARDRGSKLNGTVMAYFNNRTVWLLEPDATPIRLTRIRGEQS